MAECGKNEDGLQEPLSRSPSPVVRVPVGPHRGPRKRGGAALAPAATIRWRAALAMNTGPLSERAVVQAQEQAARRCRRSAHAPSGDGMRTLSEPFPS